MFVRLDQPQIEQLTRQGCTATDWGKISIHHGNDLSRIVRCNFIGEVEIGDFCGLAGGTSKIGLPNGLYDSTIADCEIGDCVLVKNVGLLRNSVLAFHTCLFNCGVIDYDGHASLGTMALLNEGGGRPVPLSPLLSAPVAHVLCHYRHEAELCNALTEKLMWKMPCRCSIGQGTTICNCKKILNVCFGAENTIDGAELLENGHVGIRNIVGTGVNAQNFVIKSDNIISDGAMLERTFVGEGCEIGKQFSAVDSAFFANCQAFHGEACSLFAGPYTVTHHKSTLLIACQTSFFNAGSATNQSNHLYKLGPLHQGIMERGCKTASSSYVMWPGHIGAFSMVMGHHGKHLDTSALPFSYVLERDGKSFIMPGANLRSVGTWRDNDKWPKRDRRQDREQSEPLISTMLTPYTAQKIVNAISLLQNLKQNAAGNEVHYNGCTIKLAALSAGIRLYQLALGRFIFDTLSIRIKADDNNLVGAEAWVDWSGLVMPQSVGEDMIGAMKDKNIDIVKINQMLRDVLTQHKQHELNWVLNYLQQQGIAADEALRQAASEANMLDEMVLDDAENDFADFTKIGYGIEGKPDTIDADFSEVRGSANDNSFIKQIKQRIMEREKFA